MKKIIVDDKFIELSDSQFALLAFGMNSMHSILASVSAVSAVNMMSEDKKLTLNELSIMIIKLRDDLTDLLK